MTIWLLSLSFQSKGSRISISGSKETHSTTNSSLEQRIINMSTNKKGMSKGCKYTIIIYYYILLYYLLYIDN